MLLLTKHASALRQCLPMQVGNPRPAAFYAHSRPALRVCTTAQSSGTGPSSSDGAGGADDPVSQIYAHRQQQMRASKVLETLLQAPDLVAAAKQNVSDFDESFFAVADGYLNLARKEAAADVVDLLESVIRAAMDAKQSTLRPEIQLLNRLISAKDSDARKQVLEQPDIKAVLSMDNGYFFALLDRFEKDMAAQPAANPHRDVLLAQLRDIKQLATAAAK